MYFGSLGQSSWGYCSFYWRSGSLQCIQTNGFWQYCCKDGLCKSFLQSHKALWCLAVGALALFLLILIFYNVALTLAVLSWFSIFCNKVAGWVTKNSSRALCLFYGILSISQPRLPCYVQVLPRFKKKNKVSLEQSKTKFGHSRKSHLIRVFRKRNKIQKKKKKKKKRSIIRKKIYIKKWASFFHGFAQTKKKRILWHNNDI